MNFAVIHGESRLRSAVATSDIDVVSEIPAADLVRRVRPLWRERGLHVIIIWPYDVAGTASIFLSTHDAKDGVQIDALHDPAGKGRYGFRSDMMLRHSVIGERFPILDTEATRTYLTRKSLIKGQVDRLHDLIQQGDPSFPLADEVLSSRAALEIRSEAQRTRLSKNRTVVFQPIRWIRRLTRPIGSWSHFQGGSDPAGIASEVGTRFARFVPHVKVDELRQGWRRVDWWTRQVVAIRWRPGAFMSWAENDRGTPQGCDVLVVDPRNADDAARQVVETLELRLR